MFIKKSFIVALSAITITTSVYAQKKSGAIQYETQIDPVAAAEATGFPMSEEMKARLPKSIKANYELLFSSIGASYTPVVETEDSNSEGGGRGRMNMGRMMMRFGGFGGGNKEYYYNFADKKVSEVADVMDTTYVMPGKLTVQANTAMMSSGGQGNNQNNNNGLFQILPDPPTIEVTKTDETKKILNLDCQKTIVKITRKAKILDMDKNIIEEVSLWQTKQLGFDFSPDPNLWTEGVVLAIEKKGGDITAKSIDFRGVSNRDVSVPKKAISITQEQYQEKLKAMSNRFRNMRGGQVGGRPATISIH